MEAVPWLDDRQQEAWRSLQFMQMRLTAQLTRDLAASSDLSYQDYVVLVVLTDLPDGRIRVSELSRELGWEKSRTSHHIARMVGRGLVTKERCPTDGRGAFAAITDRGRREIEAAAPGHAAAVRRLFVDRLSPAQLETVAEVARTVLRAVAEEAGEERS